MREPMEPTLSGKRTMLERIIPKSGERLPAFGMGTWETFDVTEDPQDRAPVRAVLDRFLAAGARVIDSSPMYGRSEAVVGDLVQQSGKQGVPFLATKLWTRGKADGIHQMERSFQR